MPASAKAYKNRNSKAYEQSRFSTYTIVQGLSARQAEGMYVGYEGGFAAFSDPAFTERLRRRFDFPVHDQATHDRLVAEGGMDVHNWGPLLTARQGLLGLGIRGDR